MRASTESFLALSINPHVLITAISAFAGSETNFHPSAASLPANSSESVSFRAQPKVTKATVLGDLLLMVLVLTMR
jgi:hypothetical protein